MKRETEAKSRRSDPLNRALVRLSYATLLVMVLLAIHMADHLLRSGWSTQRLVEIIVLSILGLGLFLSAKKNYVGFGLLLSVNLVGAYLVPRGHFFASGSENVVNIIHYWDGFAGIFFAAVVYGLFIAIILGIILAANALILRKRID